MATKLQLIVRPPVASTGPADARRRAFAEWVLLTLCYLVVERHLRTP